MHLDKGREGALDLVSSIDGLLGNATYDSPMEEHQLVSVVRVRSALGIL